MIIDRTVLRGGRGACGVGRRDAGAPVQSSGLRRVAAAGATAFAVMTGWVAPASAGPCTVILPFAHASTAVAPIHREVLQVIRQRNGGRRLQLTGFGDGFGHRDANDDLAQRRLRVVGTYLTARTGISLDVRKVVAPPRRAGRRVEIVVPDCDPQDFAGTGAILVRGR